jgi:glycosyltransferase involved in cell wall biosynthesis
MALSFYICYFGIRAPLVQTQVLPYLRELRKGTYAGAQLEISILTFEPEPLPDAEVIKSGLASEGIEWFSLPYHKRFSVLATAWDILRGTLFVRRFIARKRPDILHGRVHEPTLQGALARTLSRHKPPWLFDIRGFFPEEYPDAGIWPEGGWLYRTAKRVERWLMKEADGFVVLTEKAREILFPESRDAGLDRSGRPVEVIPCCVDLSRFDSANRESRKQLRAEYDLADRFVVAYVGAFGGWYLTEETADFFGAVKSDRPDAFALVLTQSSPAMIEDLLRQRGYRDEDFLITSVDPKEIPRYLSGADAAVSLIKRCYSKQASSPTKNAEYLACGLPMIANTGVGDVDLLIDQNRVGALVSELSPEAYSGALVAVGALGDVSEQCRITAREQFGLETVGGVRYRRIYRMLIGPAGSDGIQPAD